MVFRCPWGWFFFSLLMVMWGKKFIIYKTGCKAYFQEPLSENGFNLSIKIKSDLMEVDQIATKYIGMVWEVSESFMQELPWTSLWNWYRCSLVPAIDFMVALPLSAIAAMDSSWQGGFQPLIASTFYLLCHRALSGNWWDWLYCRCHRTIEKLTPYGWPSVGRWEISVGDDKESKDECLSLLISVSSRGTVWWYDLHVFQSVPSRMCSRVLQWWPIH